MFDQHPWVQERTPTDVTTSSNAVETFQTKSRAAHVWSAPWVQERTPTDETNSSNAVETFRTKSTWFWLLMTTLDTSAATVIPKLDKVFSDFGVSEVEKSDNGPPFNSKEFASFADDLEK